MAPLIQMQGLEEATPDQAAAPIYKGLRQANMVEGKVLDGGPQKQPSILKKVNSMKEMKGVTIRYRRLALIPLILEFRFKWNQIR